MVKRVKLPQGGISGVGAVIVDPMVRWQGKEPRHALSGTCSREKLKIIRIWSAPPSDYHRRAEIN